MQTGWAEALKGNSQGGTCAEDWSCLRCVKDQKVFILHVATYLPPSEESVDVMPFTCHLSLVSRPPLPTAPLAHPATHSRRVNGLFTAVASVSTFQERWQTFSWEVRGFALMGVWVTQSQGLSERKEWDQLEKSWASPLQGKRVLSKEGVSVTSKIHRCRCNLHLYYISFASIFFRHHLYLLKNLKFACVMFSCYSV